MRDDANCTREAGLEQVAARLNACFPNVSGEAVGALAQQLLPLWSEPVAATAPAFGRPAQVPQLRFVVRDEDLRLLDAVLDGAKTAAAAGFFLSSVQGVALGVAGVGLAASILKLLYNAYGKGVRLDPVEFAIVALLGANARGLSEDDLAARLTSAHPTMTRDKIAAALARLTEAPAPSGKVALVWCRDGVWRTTGV